MNKPRIYDSSGVLLNFFKKTPESDLVRYIRSLYDYIDNLERKVEIEDMKLGNNIDDGNIKHFSDDNSDDYFNDGTLRHFED